MRTNQPTIGCPSICKKTVSGETCLVSKVSTPTDPDFWDNSQYLKLSNELTNMK